MPIYEYHCKSCGQDFELMRRRDQMDVATKCLHCSSKATKRKLSMFAPVRVASAPVGDPDFKNPYGDDDDDHMHGMDDDDDCC